MPLIYINMYMYIIYFLQEDLLISVEDLMGALDGKLLMTIDTFETG